MSKFILIAATALTVLTGAALPAAARDAVDTRAKHQSHAIEAGRETGKITWIEGLKLRRQQRQIADLEAQYRSDGKLSSAERKALAREQDIAARNIQGERTDGWSRLWFLPRVGK